MFRYKLKLVFLVAILFANYALTPYALGICWETKYGRFCTCTMDIPCDYYLPPPALYLPPSESSFCGLDILISPLTTIDKATTFYPVINVNTAYDISEKVPAIVFAYFWEMKFGDEAGYRLWYSCIEDENGGSIFRCDITYYDGPIINQFRSDDFNDWEVIQGSIESLNELLGSFPNICHLYKQPGIYNVTYKIEAITSISYDEGICPDIHTQDLSCTKKVLVGDILDPNPTMIDENGNIIGDNNKLLSLLNDPDRKYSRIGAVADGVSKLLIVMQSDEDVTFDMGTDTNDMGTDTNDMGTDTNGTLSNLAGTENNKTNITIKPIEIEEGVYCIIAVYTPPEIFEEPPTDRNDREIAIKATINLNIDGSIIPYETDVKLKIVRPPVILVHGIWGSREEWRPTGMIEHIKSQGFNVLVADYSSKTLDGRQRNAVPVSEGYGKLAIQKEIASAFSNYHKDQIAISQVDIVAHSMGGLHARWYIQDKNYRCKDNYMKGYFHRLITLATPHFGSPLGKLALPKYKDNLHIIIVKGVPLFFTSGDLAKRLGMPVDQGATEEFIPGSYTYKTLLQDVSIKCHTIVDFWRPSAWGMHGIMSSFFAYYMGDPSITVDGMFNYELNDLIVGAKSQGGGLSGLNTTLFDSTIHTYMTPFTKIENKNIKNNPKVHEYVSFLLKTDRPEFFADVLPKPVIPATPAPPAYMAPKQIKSEGTEAVIITSPADGSVFSHAPGTPITITAEAIGGASPQIIFFAIEGVGILPASESPPYTVTFNVPPSTPLGKLDVFVLALDVTGLSLGSMINISLIPSLPLANIQVEPTEVLLTSEYPTEQLMVSGDFGEGSLVDITNGANGTTYNALKGNEVVHVDENGFVTATGVGDDTIEIKNGEFTVSVEVSVLSFQPNIPKSLQLNIGWNLISYPVQPLDNSIGKVLESIAGKYNSVFAYNTQTNSWQYYIITGGSPIVNNLATIDPDKGYWLNMKEDATLAITGQPISDPTIPLLSGWNLAGYKGTDGKLRSEAISSIYQYCMSMFAYDTLSNSWQYYINSGGSAIVNDLDSMYHGRGYWINSMSDCVWDPNTSSPAAPMVFISTKQTTPRPELPYIFYGNVEVDGMKVSKGSKYIPSIILKMDGKTKTTYRMLSEKGYGEYYTFEVPVTGNYSKLEIYVEIDGDISKAGELPIGLPGKVTKYDLSYTRTPNESRLLQNYPNPFNPETWIPYQLKESSEVEIRIYNATGRLVRTLELGYKPSGYYDSQEKAAYWDGKNEYGEIVVSGVYFYSIKAGKLASTRKMLIIR